MSASAGQPIRIVYLEDDPGAFALVQALLTDDGLACVLECVEDEAAYTRALQPAAPDLILADFNLPTMDGFKALALKRQLCATTPFIFVSGALGENVAIDALQHGATDFVLKDSLARLPSAVRRALTEAQQLREKLLAEEKLHMLSQAVDQSPVAVGITDLAGAIVFANPCLCSMTGYTETELIGRAPQTLQPDDADPHPVAAAWTALQRGASWTGQLAFRHKQGAAVHVRATFAPMRGPDGAARNFLMLAEDIDQWLQDQERQRRLESQLFQAQKLESIGTLAGGIAHDFNNILTGILGFAELAAQTSPRDAEVQEDLREIRSAGLRAKDLVAQILTFSRQGETRLVPLDLARPVNEALKLVRASTPATIAIERVLEPGVVRADPTQIHQIILNLCTNAVHAMRDRTGRIDVAVRKITVDAAVAAENPDLSAGEWMRLTVSDTGHGMDEPTVTRIFDPFFTTKQPGEGTGLGLAIVQGIVASHSGALRVRSQPGQGTTFSIFLPAATASESAASSSEPVPHGAGEEILVVDDEPAVAQFAGACLSRCGYRTTVFPDAVAALAACRATPGRFRAIVTDLTMPRLTGLDLLQQARVQDPDLPAVIMSGYHTASAHTTLINVPRCVVLTKPFASDDLVHAVHRTLQSEAKSHLRPADSA